MECVLLTQGLRELKHRLFERMLKVPINLGYCDKGLKFEELTGILG